MKALKVPHPFRRSTPSLLGLITVILFEFGFSNVGKSQINEKSVPSNFVSASVHIQPAVLWIPRNAISTTLQFSNIDTKTSTFFGSGIGFALGRRSNSKFCGVKSDISFNNSSMGFWWTGVPNADGTGQRTLLYPYTGPPTQKEVDRRFPHYSFQKQVTLINLGVLTGLEWKRFSISIEVGISFQSVHFLNQEIDQIQWGSIYSFPSDNGDTVAISYVQNFQPENKNRRKTYMFAFGEFNIEYQVDKSGIFRPFVGVYYQQKIYPEENAGEKEFHFVHDDPLQKEIGTTTWKDNMSRLSFQFGLKAQIPLKKRVKLPE